MQFSLEVPRDVSLGDGAFSPDSRYYFLATSLGIARIVVDPPSFDRFIGPPAGVTRLSVAPLGTTLHAVGSFGRAVVDWESGTVLVSTCCSQPAVFFTPAGATRIEVDDSATPARVTAYSELEGQLLWAAEGEGAVAVSDTHVAHNEGDSIVVREVSSGTVITRIPVRAGEMAWGDDPDCFPTAVWTRCCRSVVGL